jgi:hypothetical protein
MGLLALPFIDKPCVGGANCRKYDCKQRCKSWFSGLDELERQCKNACKGDDRTFTKDEFLCSGKWVDDQNVILQYGYDPCPNRGASVEDTLDPLGDRAREDERLKKILPVFVALLVLAAAGFGIFMVMKK